MGAFGDRAGVLQERALEQNMRERNEQRLFVNRVEHSFERGGRAVVRLDPLDAEAAIARVRFVDVHDRREFEFGVDDFVAARVGGRVKAGEDERLADRDVLMHRDRAGVCADDAPDLVANRERHLPPAFSPCAHAARRPRLGILADALERRARHRAQTVRDEIHRLVENRKFPPPLQKLVSQKSSPPPVSNVVRCASADATAARCRHHADDLENEIDSGEVKGETLRETVYSVSGEIGYRRENGARLSLASRA